MNETRPVILEVVNTATTTTCAATTPTESKNTIRAVWSDSRSGVQNPFWRDQTRKGISATTDYSRNGYRILGVSTGRATFYARCGSPPDRYQKRTYRGVYVGIPQNITLSGPSATKASNEAIMKFIHDCKAQYNQIGGMQFLAELRDTLHMIRKPAQSLRNEVARYFDALKRKRQSYRTSASAQRGLAGTWLEYSFGWAPLISDTVKGAEALSRLIEGDIRYTTVSGFGQDVASLVNITTFQPFAGLPFKALKTVTQEVTALTKIVGGITATPTGRTLQNAKALYGFNAEEFVPTIWEIVPWSFLVDYFVNVGDVLEATFFNSGQVTWTSRSDVLKNVYSASAVLDQKSVSDYDWSGGGSLGSVNLERKNFSRTKSTTLIPQLSVSLPGSPQKWINMAALAASRKSLTPYFR